MFGFKRKPKNRRLGREYVLDVKLRSSQVRSARARMAALALGVVFATVLGVFLLWRGGELALNRLVYQNPAFAIDRIDIQTDGVLPPDLLRHWTGVRPGDNLLALDLASVIRDLQMVSLIKSVSVERILPHTLRVRVVEREPVAQVNVPRPRPGGGVEMSTVQLDEDGYVLVPVDAPPAGGAAAPTPEPLPLLDGINSVDLQAGRRLDAPRIQAALQLLVAFDRSPMAGLVEIKRLDVSTPDVVVVTTGQGSEITFGLSNPDLQLSRWQQIFNWAQNAGKSVATLDLAVSNNVPATWLEASVVPPSTPKRHKSPKKKHV